MSSHHTQTCPGDVHVRSHLQCLYIVTPLHSLTPYVHTHTINKLTTNKHIRRLWTPGMAGDMFQSISIAARTGHTPPYDSGCIPHPMTAAVCWLHNWDVHSYKPCLNVCQPVCRHTTVAPTTPRRSTGHHGYGQRIHMDVYTYIQTHMDTYVHTYICTHVH